MPVLLPVIHSLKERNMDNYGFLTQGDLSEEVNFAVKKVKFLVKPKFIWNNKKKSI